MLQKELENAFDCWKCELPHEAHTLELIKFNSRHPFRFLHNALLNTYAEAPDDEYSS